MYYIIIFFWFCSRISSCLGVDPDFTEYYNTVENSIKNHHELKTISDDPCLLLPKLAETAIVKWEKRKNITCEYYRYDLKKEGYGPEDALAIEKGSKYCTDHYNYWIARKKSILALKERIGWLKEIEEIFDLAKSLLSDEKYFPGFCEKENDFSFVWMKSKIADTKEIWLDKLLDLKKSLFRSIKKENSDIAYEENGQVLGALYTSFWSMTRKVSRVYNEGAFYDAGPNFKEGLEVFDKFCRFYMEFLRPKSGVQPKLIFQTQFNNLFFEKNHIFSNENKRSLLIELVSIVDQVNKK